MFGVFHKPSTISECRDNLLKVASVIKQRRADLPGKYLSEKAIESILKGEKQAVYALLYHLKACYPEGNGENQPPRSHYQSVIDTIDTDSCLALPYTPQEIRMLDQSILNWLRQLGVLSKCSKIPCSVHSLIELQRDICNGTILCELVQVVFNLKIHGVFKDPKTDTTCI